MISQKEEMRTGTESSGVVLHDMIERIYFYFIIYSKKRNGMRETHGTSGSSSRRGSSPSIWRERINRQKMFPPLQNLPFNSLTAIMRK
jgi:hypothetical protein